MGLLFALFSWGSGGGTYDDLGIPVSDFGVLIFFSFGEGSVAGLYTCQSHIQIVYITKSGHGIETHLRSNLAQLLEGYGLGIAMAMLANCQPLSMALHTDEGVFSAAIFKYV